MDNLDLKILQSLPLETLELWTVEKINELIESCEKTGKTPFLCFSGGLDSSVGKYIIDKHFSGEIVSVFSNTGQEFNSIVRFVKSFDGVITVKPKINFREVVKKYGFPAISKHISRCVNDMQNPTKNNLNTRKLRMTGIKKDGSKASSASILPKKWHFLVNGPRLSERCCQYLKKDPLENYAKSTNGVPIICTRVEESSQRKLAWHKSGCNNLNAKKPKSSPLSIWTSQKILMFIVENEVPYCKEIYGEITFNDGVYSTTGESSTGCCGCLFGCEYDRDRYVRLKRIDPKKYKFCMESGAKEVLEFLKIPSYEGQYENCEMFVKDENDG